MLLPQEVRTGGPLLTVTSPNGMLGKARSPSPATVHSIADVERETRETGDVTF